METTYRNHNTAYHPWIEVHIRPHRRPTPSKRSAKPFLPFFPVPPSGGDFFIGICSHGKNQDRLEFGAAARVRRRKCDSPLTL